MVEDGDPDRIDWRLTTFEGARRETLRRWAALPLEQVVAALEEMAQTASALGAEPGSAGGDLRRANGPGEPKRT